MIAIIDYGAGNLGSVYKAFRFIGANAQVTNDASSVENADALVLPGVGAFGHCMSGLARVNLSESTKRFIESGRPFLGICVGLQMLFETSEETDSTRGLGVLKGKVVRFEFGIQNAQNERRETYSASERLNTQHLKVPHIGWNELEFNAESALFQGLEQGERVYFVHSYFPQPADSGIVSARSDYGGRFCCAVESGNIHATQFHPEKSGAAGLQILRNFVSLAS
jgi:glutamine amidotransferase